MGWHKITEQKQAGSFKLWWRALAWELDGLGYNPYPATKGLPNSDTLSILSLVSKIAVNNHWRMPKWQFSFIALSPLECGVIVRALDKSTYRDVRGQAQPLIPATKTNCSTALREQEICFFSKSNKI